MIMTREEILQEYRDAQRFYTFEVLNYIKWGARFNTRRYHNYYVVTVNARGTVINVRYTCSAPGHWPAEIRKGQNIREHEFCRARYFVNGLEDFLKGGRE